MLQRRTLKNLATLEVVVNIFDGVHRIKNEKQRLAGDGVDHLSSQRPVAQAVDRTCSWLQHCQLIW